MKRIFSFYAGIIMVFLVITGAGGCVKAKPVKEDGKISVISVNFPPYDFVRVIAGDKVKLRMLLPPGAESHTYEPSPIDLISVKECDLFIYPGGENSSWVERILSSLDNPEGKIKILKLLDMIDAVEEVIVEGMEADNDKSEEGAPVYDEHIWTAPLNAKAIAACITNALCDLDGANADFYRKNAADYSARLDDLDAAFRSVVKGAKRNTIVFGDRFPSRYLANAYGLSYYAAFPGCSSETEPSAATVAFLIKKIKSENIPVVFYIELSSQKMADTISEATGAKKLLLHSGHNLSKTDFEKGISYLDLQNANVENLREALW